MTARSPANYLLARNTEADGNSKWKDEDHHALALRSTHSLIVLMRDRLMGRSEKCHG